MYRQVKYTIKIHPQPQKNLRKNINALYVVLISDKDNHRIFSQPILVDSVRESQISSANDIEYNRMELWNYDKMKMMEEQKIAFGMSDQFTFCCKAEEVIYEVSKSQVAKTSSKLGAGKGSEDGGCGWVGKREEKLLGEYQNSAKNNKANDISNKTESQQESSRQTRNNKPSSIRIISAKEYHAY